MIITSNLSVCATVVMFRNRSPLPISSRVIPTFSTRRFRVAGFMERSLIHLHFSFVHGDRSFTFLVSVTPRYFKLLVDIMKDYIDGFSYVEPSLHRWDEDYLMVVDDFSDMFLDSVR
ncbi:hypothetical protein H671_5g14109 [Cricetulus griseus]|nr:hypothetical protein H671_5g14109 [Cricetulus griseus]